MQLLQVVVLKVLVAARKRPRKAKRIRRPARMTPREAKTRDKPPRMQDLPLDQVALPLLETRRIQTTHALTNSAILT